MMRAGDIEYVKEIISTFSFSGLRLRAASRSLVGQSVLGHEERFQ
jgi:hypothetical protein